MATAPKYATRIAADVGWLPISFVNVYFLGKPGEPWVLVDTGLPGRARQIIEAAIARYGSEARPEAIVLTHGHFDHASNALELAMHWDVPVYAHPMELPYLTGQSHYPPPDPTLGGAIAFLSRFMPSKATDLRGYVKALEGSDVPGAQEWRWMATPGHSPGHVSLFRENDRTLIAGDAFATMDMDSWSGLISAKQVLARAGAPFNTDWQATTDSVRRLGELQPRVVAAGHGVPLENGDVASRVMRFADTFRPPRRGRYVRRPAVTNEGGVVSLPAAPFDPVPFATAAGLLAAGIALGSGALDGVVTKKQ